MSLSLRRYLCPCISGDVCVPTVPVSPEISMSLYLWRFLCPCYVAAAARVSGRTLSRTAGRCVRPSVRLVHGSCSENGLVSRARPGTPFPGRSSLARRARRVNESPRRPLLGGGWPRGRRTAGRLKFGAGSQAGLQRGGRPVGEHCRLPASRGEARGSRREPADHDPGGGRSMISESQPVAVRFFRALRFA